MQAENKEKMRESKERAEKKTELKQKQRKGYRWKAGCDGGGGVPKLCTDPCRNRCI